MHSLGQKKQSHRVNQDSWIQDVMTASYDISITQSTTEQHGHHSSLFKAFKKPTVLHEPLTLLLLLALFRLTNAVHAKLCNCAQFNSIKVHIQQPHCHEFLCKLKQRKTRSTGWHNCSLVTCSCQLSVMTAMYDACWEKNADERCMHREAWRISKYI